MSFPEVRFGICPSCGNKGPDQEDDLTDADAAARDTTGNGTILFLHKGKLMCNICSKELDADRESVANARKHAESEKFRAKAGFITSVED